MDNDESGIFDRRLIDRRRARALKQAAPAADFLLARLSDDLADRLSVIQRRFAVAVDLGGHTGLAAEAIDRSGKADRILRIERDPGFLKGPFAAVVGDEETLPLGPGSADFIVSMLSLQTINDLPGTLVQIRRALRPDGLFLAAMAGAGTLSELREALIAAESELRGGVSPRVGPFADIRDAGGLLQRAGFALPVTDVDTLTVRYDTMFGLVGDLRAMGMQNALVGRSRRPATRQLFTRAAEIYAERFSDPDGRVRATFSFIWISGWAPDPSQQKPLKPGSAQVSMAALLDPGAKR
jgi:SAM-dependent methyltransferase